jgi:hypothetical protein
VSSRPGDGGQPIALFLSVLALIVVAAAGITVASPDTDVSDSSPTAAASPAAGDEEENDAITRQNLLDLQEALGDAFAVAGEELVSLTAPGLPPDLTASATVTVLPDSGQPFACPAADPQGSCRKDGDDLLIESAGAIHSAAGSNFGARTIRHHRSNGEIVVVQLSVLGRPAAGSTYELEDAVRAWLTSMEPTLITAAQDDRLVVTPD